MDKEQLNNMLSGVIAAKTGGVPPPQEKPKKKKQKFNPDIILYAVVLIIVGVLLYIFLFSGPKDCKQDLNCFFDHLEQCDEAEVISPFDQILIHLETNDKCQITKTIYELPESEPDEMKAAFEGKSMVCNYNPQFFNYDLIYTLSKGLDNCQGELKDALYTLIVAQMNP